MEEDIPISDMAREAFRKHVSKIKDKVSNLLEKQEEKKLLELDSLLENLENDDHISIEQQRDIENILQNNDQKILSQMETLIQQLFDSGCKSGETEEFDLVEEFKVDIGERTTDNYIICLAMSPVTRHLLVGGVFGLVMLDQSGNLLHTSQDSLGTVTAIAFGSKKDDIYVLGNLDTLCVLDNEVKCQSSLPLSFDDAIGLAVDENDNVYVSDVNKNIIYQKKADINRFDVFIKGPHLQNPECLCLTKEKNLLVTCPRVKKIQKYSKIGELIWEVDCGKYSDPSDLIMDLSGNVFVTDMKNNIVFHISEKATGNEANSRDLDMKVARSPSLKRPTGISIDQDGNVLIAYSYNFIGKFKIK